MTRRTFTRCAWLMMLSAFTTVPVEYLTYTLHGRVDPVTAILQGGIQLAETLLYAAITLILKRFLNRVFTFHETDRSIEVMVTANVVAGVLVLGGICFPGIRETVNLIALALMVGQGVVQLLFGYKLLRLSHDLGGLLKPFCYLNMATGVCVASIVLTPAGVVLSAVSDLMLATIYFNMAKELKDVAQSRSEAK